MLRKLIRMSLAGTLGMLALTLAVGASNSATAQDKDKAPSISDIMLKGHKGPDAYIAKIKGAVKDGKWEDAQGFAKELASFGEHLGKQKPPKGEDDSWKKLTTKYAETTKATYTAAKEKDAKGVNKGLGGINCMECHKAHR
jgi:hypothetical protein